MLFKMIQPRGSHWGDFAPPREFRQCMDTFLVVTGWVLMASGAKVRDAVTHPTNDLAHNVRSGKAEKPCWNQLYAPHQWVGMVSPHPHTLVTTIFIYYF